MDDGTLEVIRNSVLRVVPETAATAVTPDRTLAELGCNSIDRADIVTMVMEELDVIVPLEEFHQSHTLRQLAELLRKYA